MDKNSIAFTSNISNYLGSPCDICRCLDTRAPNFCSSLLHLACHWGTMVLLVPLDFFPHISKILNTDLNYLFFNSSQINVLVRPLSHLMIMSFVMEIPGYTLSLKRITFSSNLSITERNLKSSPQTWHSLAGGAALSNSPACSGNFRYRIDTVVSSDLNNILMTDIHLTFISHL